MLLSSNASGELQTARDTALKDRNYDSERTRRAMVQKLQDVFDGRSPYDWQLDVAEALVLGLDCVVVAGTGAGKTIPFALPLLVQDSPDKLVLIISPLNALETDQADRFKKMGISAVTVNGDSYTNDLHRRIESQAYNIIITSPEMCLEDTRFSRLLRMPDFTRNILSIVIDEAHCVSEWGENFRKACGELGRLRFFVPATIPFLVTSATLPAHILDNVVQKLHISKSRSVFLNLGNDCLNITHMVCRIRGSKSDLGALDFIVDAGSTGGPLIRTIVFFESRLLTYKGYKHLQQRLPSELRSRVDFLHSCRSSRSKKIVMERFRSGVTDILCATEAAGMGLDIRDISRVVGFMAPKSLSTWMQRSGRAGQSGLPAIAILLVEPYVFQLQKTTEQKSNEKRRVQDKSCPVKQEDVEDEVSSDGEGCDHDDPIQDEDTPSKSATQLHDVDLRYKKKLDGGLRYWIDPQHHDCRREVSNTYFGNPPSQIGLTAPCCDLCVLKKFADTPDSLTPDESDILALRDRIMTRKAPADQVPQEQGDQPGNENDIDALQRPVRNGTGEGPRRGDRLEACRNALRTWRFDTWKRDFEQTILMPEVILPDKVLSKLATQARLKTVDLIKEEIPGWFLASQYGEAVLKVLEPIDKAWIEETEQKREENRAKRAKRSAENKIRRDEDARAARLRASDERRAAQKASVSQRPQSYIIPNMNIAQQASVSQPLQSYAPHANPLTYPSYYPYPYYNYYPYAYSHPQTINQGASSSQPAPGPSVHNAYSYYSQPSG